MQEAECDSGLLGLGPAAGEATSVIMLPSEGYLVKFIFLMFVIKLLAMMVIGVL